MWAHLWRNCVMVQLLWKAVWQFPSKLKLLYGPAVLLLNIYQDVNREDKVSKIESRVLEKYLHTHVHSTIIHNSQEIKATQCPLTDKWIRKCGIYIQWNIIQMKGILLHTIMCKTLETLCWLKWTSHKRTNPLWFYLHEVFRVVKFIETARRWV